MRARPTPGRAAARRSARSRPGRGGRRTAGRRAAARRRARRTPPASRRGAGRARSARRRSARRSRSRSSSSRPSISRGAGLAQRAGARHPRASAVAPRDDLDVRHAVAPSGSSGSRSEKLRCTGPGRPSTAVQNARQASWRSQRTRGGARRVIVDLEVPLGGAAVELDLVDRLPGADVAQLRRAVGGQDQQRHARLVGLDHGGRVVGGGGARGAGQRGGNARSPWPVRGRRTPRSARRCARSRAVAIRGRSVSTSGVEREPGEVHASRRPQRTSSSTKARRPR